MSRFIQALPACSLDIVGDVHGELDALRALLRLLGYADDGHHPEGRRLVFLGDLVDRGPDSVGVVQLVRRLVDAGRAQVVLGNHELNLLRHERKHGNDWFWNETSPRDRVFAPCTHASAEERESMLAWFDSWPLALQRDDLRIVHAAWDAPSLKRLSQGTGPIAEQFAHWDRLADEQLAASGVMQRAEAEHAEHHHHYADKTYHMPMLGAYGLCEEQRQMLNPLRVLTSGVERCADAPFYTSASCQWRFARRMPWWDDYADDVPVVVGHFWRQYLPLDRKSLGKGDGDLFAGIAPSAWLGPRGRVYCVDFSVGGRYRERIEGRAHDTRLAALRWPERELVLDDGQRLATTGYAGVSP
jgi:hypothetical protein